MVLEPIIRKLQIQNLQAQLKLRRLECESLMKEFQNPVPLERDIEIARRWKQLMEECEELQFKLEWALKDE